MKQKTKYKSILIAVSAMYAALLVGGKEALAVLPNIEVVTLLIAVCAYVWGPIVVFPAVNVFIAVDMAIWGVNTWIISYLIHWNTVAVIFWLLGRVHFKRKVTEIVVATAVAVAVTTVFGVLTSAVDTLVGYTGKGFFVDFDNVLYRFGLMYGSGVTFFVTQILCNLVLFTAVFDPLVKLNRKAQLRMLPSPEQPQAEQTEDEQSN